MVHDNPALFGVAPADAAILFSPLRKTALYCRQWLCAQPAVTSGGYFRHSRIHSFGVPPSESRAALDRFSPLFHQFAAWRGMDHSNRVNANPNQEAQ